VDYFVALQLFRIKNIPQKNIILILQKNSSANASANFSKSLMFLTVFSLVSFSSNCHCMF